MVNSDVIRVSEILGISVIDLYQFSNNQSNHYRLVSIPKKSGGIRELNVPSHYLKHIQRCILDKLLYSLPVSEYAKAYLPDAKLIDNALPHIGKEKVLKLDIKSFFDNIDSDMVCSVFSRLGFESAATSLLANICTLEGVLPQGAPTSPHIANLVMMYFDNRVGDFCKVRNVAYTRYCDDMTFSGDFEEKEITCFVEHLLLKQGFELNHKKTTCISSSQQQKVTGIVVNEKPQISSAERRKIRQEVYYLSKYTVLSCMRKMDIHTTQIEYLTSLQGRISFALQINPDDKKMREYYDIVHAVLKKKTMEHSRKMKNRLAVHQPT